MKIFGVCNDEVRKNIAMAKVLNIVEIAPNLGSTPNKQMQNLIQS